MLIEKCDLLKTIKLVANFDTGASPYASVHFPAEGKPEFSRTSGNGFIQTKDYVPDNLAYISLPHLQDCLKVSAESIDMRFRNGSVILDSTQNSYNNDLVVHTVKAAAAGVKTHQIGEPGRVRLDPSVFLGLNMASIRTVSQPVLKDGRLLLPTLAGMVIWTTPDSLKPIQLYPRDSFLRFVCGTVLESLMISEKGYWGAARDGVFSFLSGHTINTQLFDKYNTPGTEVSRLNAPRLVQALYNSTVLCGDNDGVEMDYKSGIVCKDKFGNEQKFSLGASHSWPRFVMMGKSAKLLVDALSQSKEEDVVLYSIPPKPGQSTTMRLVRGDFEVNFNV